MLGARKLIGTAGLAAALSAAVLVAPSAASTGTGSVALAGSVAPFAAQSRSLGAVTGSTRLTVEVWLRPDIAGASRFATAVSTPGSRLFQHYLSPRGYAARFAASPRSAARVAAWLRSQGFTAVGVDAGRDYVRATATTARIERAFHVQLDRYRATARVNAGPYQLRANDRPVSLPADLAGSVLGVTGLDNAAPVLPLERPYVKAHSRSSAKLTTPCSHYYGQHEVPNLPRHFHHTTFPTVMCGYTAHQIRSAYGVPGKLGGGETIALVELGLTQDMYLTLADYTHANHMPAPSRHRYRQISLGRGTACGDLFDIEEQLDVESSYDIAPAAKQLVVGGDSCNDGDFGLQGLFNADLAILNGTHNHPLASVASNSWEGYDEGQPAILDKIENAYLVRAAAEGVGMYFSAGDGSGVETPSSDPFAVAVGGTTLGLGRSGNRLFETGWSTAMSFLQKHRWVLEGEQGASGGGPSVLFRRPAYQSGVVPRALAHAPGNRGGLIRSVPDISADADPFTGFAEGALTFTKGKPPVYGEFDIGGTSLASPLVAGMVIAAEEGQHHRFGWLDPVLYRFARTHQPGLHDPVPLTSRTAPRFRGVVCDQATCGVALLTTFDDQNYKMNGYTGQVTLRGYDNMTGVGTPNGVRFIRTLRRLER